MTAQDIPVQKDSIPSKSNKEQADVQEKLKDRQQAKVQEKEQKEQDKQDRQRNRQLSDKDGGTVSGKPALEFKIMEHDFGTVSEQGRKVSYDYVFTNTGDCPLVITRVITSCKCVSTNYTKKPIPPGGHGMVTVTYDPKKQQGVFYKAVQVFSNAPEGMHIIIAKGEVKP